MRIASRMKWILLILVVAALALPGSWAVAQEDEDDPEFGLEFEFEGVVVSITDEAIVVDVEGVEFILAPAGSFNPSMLSEGDMVRFNGVMLNDDTIKVTELEIVEPPADEPGEEPVEEPVDEPDDTPLACGKEDHPVITALADEFELEYDVVMGYFCDGYGVGEIARALLLAEQTDMAAEDVLAMREDGMGWGNIVKELDVNPSSLAPGRVISAEKHENKAEERERNREEEQNSGEGESQEQNQNKPGNSANAPGQQKKSNDGPGGSANAPGQQKKK